MKVSKTFIDINKTGIIKDFLKHFGSGSDVLRKSMIKMALLILPFKNGGLNEKQI